MHIETRAYRERLHAMLEAELKAMDHPAAGEAADELIFILEGALVSGVTRPDANPGRTAEHMARRVPVMAAAVGEDGLAHCAGRHQPVGPTTEIVGVGTLPSARRRGLGAAVTRALISDALTRHIATIFLSAGDTDVERLYARLGFRTVATALIAEPPGR